MIAVRRLTLADLPLVLRLRAQAGWNQTEADLRRFFDLSGEGSFIAEWDGQPAGTVCTFVFGSTAWIAMMLVEEALRGRGIGKALMQRALAFLDDGVSNACGSTRRLWAAHYTRSSASSPNTRCCAMRAR